MTLDPSITAKIRASFTQQVFMESIGAELTSMDKGHVEITTPIAVAYTQQHGFAHAALTFAIGDSAAGYAALSLMPPEAEVLTTEMKINLLAPAKGTHLTAKGRVLKPGRRLIVVQADVFAYDSEAETHVAALQGTMIPV